MSAWLAPLPNRRDDGVLARLVAAVPPEFSGPIIRVAPDDPVFGRGRCRATGCSRPAWTRLLCQGHYLRWRRDGQPDIAVFAATSGPIRARHAVPGSGRST